MSETQPKEPQANCPQYAESSRDSQAEFLNSTGLPFQTLLPESAIEQALVQEQVKYHQCVYSPVVTLRMFLSQVLEADKSLLNAVVRATGQTHTQAARMCER